MPTKVLRISAVIEATGLAKSTIYSKISVGKFPKPIKLGARAVGWMESDINQWINDCATNSLTNNIDIDVDVLNE